MRRREQACNIERLDLCDNDKMIAIGVAHDKKQEYEVSYKDAMLTDEGLRIQKLEYGPEKVEVALTLENHGIARGTCISNGSVESWEVRTRQLHV